MSIELAFEGTAVEVSLSAAERLLPKPNLAITAWGSKWLMKINKEEDLVRWKRGSEEGKVKKLYV
jgi:hypothetical protein